MPVRLNIRRVKPTPGCQLALFATYRYHAFITDRESDTLDPEANHRRHAEIENAVRNLKYGVGLNHLPSKRFPANAAWLAVQAIAHNLACWTRRTGPGEPMATTKTLRRRFFSLAGRLTRKARRRPCIFLRTGLGKTPSATPWSDCAPCHSHPDRAHDVRPSADLPKCLAALRRAGSRVSLTAMDMPLSPVTNAAADQNSLHATDTLSAGTNPSESTP